VLARQTHSGRLLARPSDCALCTITDALSPMHWTKHISVQQRPYGISYVARRVGMQFTADAMHDCDTTDQQPLSDCSKQSALRSSELTRQRQVGYSKDWSVPARELIYLDHARPIAVTISDASACSSMLGTPADMKYHSTTTHSSPSTHPSQHICHLVPCCLAYAG
jgi:hypothetical protein